MQRSGTKRNAAERSGTKRNAAERCETKRIAAKRSVCVRIASACPFIRGRGRVRLRALPADPPRELDVLRHDRHPLRVDGAQVRVLKQAHQVRLGSLVQRPDRSALEPQVGLKVLRNLAHQPLERQLPDEEVGGPPESGGSRAGRRCPGGTGAASSRPQSRAHSSAQPSSPAVAAGPCRQCSSVQSASCAPSFGGKKLWRKKGVAKYGLP